MHSLHKVKIVVLYTQENFQRHTVNVLLHVWLFCFRNKYKLVLESVLVTYFVVNKIVNNTY